MPGENNISTSRSSQNFLLCDGGLRIGLFKLQHIPCPFERINLEGRSEITKTTPILEGNQCGLCSLIMRRFHLHSRQRFLRIKDMSFKIATDADGSNGKGKAIK